MYLKEMGSVPLTREEEVEISKRIEKAQIQIEKLLCAFVIQRVRPFPLLTILFLQRAF